MSWTFSILLAVLALCGGQSTEPEGNSLSPSGYHLCVHNETRVVSYLAMHKVPYTVTKNCGGWLLWKTCTVTLYQMVPRTQNRTVTVQVTKCCDGYVPLGQYCASSANRSAELAAKPGSCPTADGPRCPGAGDCEWDVDCPGRQKCCGRRGGGSFCGDPASSANYSDNRGNRWNATVTVKADHHELMSKDKGLLNHTRLLHAMVTGALQPDQVWVYYLDSWPVHPYRTSTSLLVVSSWAVSLQEVTSRLHLLLKHIQEVSSVTVEDVDECEEAALHWCSPRALCNNTVGSYYCTCHQGYIDVDPGNPGAHCTDVVWTSTVTPLTHPPPTASTQEPPGGSGSSSGSSSSSSSSSSSTAASFTSSEISVTTALSNTGSVPYNSSLQWTSSAAPTTSISSTQETTTCSPPTITTLETSNVTGTSFCVNWSSRSHSDQTYVVLLRKGSEVTDSWETNRTMMEVRGLEPGVLYNVTVTPRACGGEGVSGHVLVKTDAQTVDATARLTNINFTTDLHNSSSQAYKNLTASFIQEIYQSLSPEMKALVDSGLVKIQIRGFSQGSVLVNFTLVLTPNPSQDIANVSEALLTSLMNSSKYTVDKNNTSITDVDECVSGDNDCSQWATCSNTFGSYTCVCRETFVDNNPLRPGRACRANVTAETITPALTTGTQETTSAITTVSHPTLVSITLATVTSIDAPTTNPATAAAVQTTTTVASTTSTTASVTTTVASTVSMASPATAAAATTTTVPTTTIVALTASTAPPATTTITPETTTTTTAPATTAAAPATTTPTPTATTDSTSTAVQTTTTMTPAAITTALTTTTTTVSPTTPTTALTTTTTSPTTTTVASTASTAAPATTTATAQTTTTTIAPATTAAAPATTSATAQTTTTTTAPATTTTAPSTTADAPATTTATAQTTTTTTAPATTATAPATTTTLPSTTTAASTTSTAALATTAAAPATTTLTPTVPTDSTATAVQTTTTMTPAATTTASTTTTTTMSPTTPPTTMATSTTTVPTTAANLTTTTVAAPTTITVTQTTMATTITTTTTPTSMSAMTSPPMTSSGSAQRTVSVQGAVSVECRLAAVTVSVARDFLEENKVSDSNLYLGAVGCGVNGGNATHVQLTVAWNECATTLTHNESVYTVSVTLFNTMDPHTLLSGKVEVPRVRLVVPVMCPYMKSMLISADFNAMGYDIIKDVIMGLGSFQVTVRLMNGTMPLHQNYSLSPEDEVVVEVSLNTSSEQIRVIINKCWATPTTNPADTQTITFLENSCSINPYTNVLINGNSSTSRVSVQIFSFVNLDVIYLHCQVFICVETGADSCVPDCLQRTSRTSANKVGSTFRSVGPLHRIYTGYHEETEEAWDTVHIIGFACLGVGLTIFFILAFVCLFFYQRNRIGNYNFNVKPKQENFTYLVFNT